MMIEYRTKDGAGGIVFPSSLTTEEIELLKNSISSGFDEVEQFTNQFKSYLGINSK